MLRCIDCERDLPEDQFGVNREKKNGRMSVCRPCGRSRTKAWAQANPDKLRERDRARRLRDPQGWAQRRRELLMQEGTKARGTVLLYVLVDPRDDRVRYVGGTTCGLRVRLRTHLSAARTTDKATPVLCWIRELAEQGVRPMIRQIAEVPQLKADDVERELISSASENGWDLLNCQPGGKRGYSGHRFSDEARRNISIAAKRRWARHRAGKK